jgi:hypothetical protein
LFEAPKTLAKTRSNVLNLMRNTTPLNARSHCPQLFEPNLVLAERASVTGARPTLAKNGAR